MSDDDIDLDRVIVDPEYRRKVIAFLNGSGNGIEEKLATVEQPALAAD